MTEEPGFASVGRHDLPPAGTDRKRFDERPGAVNRWLSSLPLADLPETGRRLLGALELIRHIGLPASRRLTLLQRLEGTSGYLQEGLRRLYAHQPFPLPSRARQAARLALSLSEAMARNYRMVVLTDRGGLGGLSRSARARAMAGVVDHTGQALLSCWLLFQKPPTGAWQLLHRTWQTACRLRLQHRPPAGRDSPGSVDLLYKQLLLTDALGPWRMPRGEVVAAHALLGRCAGGARLVSVAGREPPGDAVFMIDQQQDRGVIPLLDGAIPDGDSGMLMLTEGLSGHLDQDAPAGFTVWRRQERPLSPELRERIRSIETLLAAVPRRAHARAEHEARAMLVVGLAAIHRVLEEQRDRDQARRIDVEQRAHFKARDVTAATAATAERQAAEKERIRQRTHDVWDMIYSTEPPAAPPSDEEEVTEHLVASVPGDGLAPPTTSSTHAVESGWVVVNASRAGYCLGAPSETHSSAQTGDLVIVQVTENAQGHRFSGWRTGVIRWLRRSRADGTQLGIQLIADSPEPVLTRAFRAQGGLTSGRRALLLPAVPGAEIPASLITPPQHYRRGTHVALSCRGETTELVLERQMEVMSGFRQFTFRQMGFMDLTANLEDSDDIRGNAP